LNFAVQMTGISKTYGIVKALDDVSFSVEAGTLHALVGENGAGKTTLVKALYGAMLPDEGVIEVNQNKVSFRTSKEAISSGIGMVSQHYGIIGELTNLENLVLGAEGGIVLKSSEQRNRAIQLANKMGFQFDWEDESSALSPAGGQKLEILKLLWRDSKIMILDEPTAMLSPSDSDALYESLKRLAAEGTTIIVVTHRITEVFEHCRRVTVLRGGKKISDHEVGEISPKQLAEAIVGGEVIERPTPVSKVNQDETSLEINNVSILGSKGEMAVKSASLNLKKGQLLGIAGVDGNGQRELFQALIGFVPLSQGQIIFGENWNKATTAKRIQDGLRVIPEDRLNEGVIEEWSLYENSALGLQRLSPFKDALQSAERGETGKIAERFNTKHGGLGNEMASLSGGNQQRFVAARALHLSPQLILAFQPARGLDLNSTTKVYRDIRAACDVGASAIIVSFDLDELLDFCDRIAVMCHGELSEPKPEDSRDRLAIGRLMVGAA
jgi:general nucleoside transport system ATP-binding protein